jgi:hypothetical protein
MTSRRFPPPWTIDEYNDACFIVKDADGQALAYVYFEDEPRRRSAAAHSRRGATRCCEYREAARTVAAIEAARSSLATA